MPNIFSDFLDRDNPVRKLQKEIEGMVFKKQTLIASVQSEIQGAKQKIDMALHKIGSAVYEGHINDSPADEKLHEYFNEITEIKSFIQEKEAKINEIASRYDEEIGMLNSQIGLVSQQAITPPPVNVPAQSGSANVCSKCGKPYNPSEDSFCVGCGQKLG